MKRLPISIVITAALLIFCSEFIHAESSYNNRFDKGRYVTTVQFGIGYSSYSGMGFGLWLNNQKFIQSRFALGFNAAYSNFEDFEYYGLGPSASYYFWHNENWHGFVSQKFEVRKYSGYSSTGGHLGDDDLGVMGKTFVGIGLAGIEVVSGYNYVLNTAADQRPGLFLGVQFSFYFDAN